MLKELANKHHLDYFLISFVDLFGVIRSKLVPKSAIAEMSKSGAGFAGFAAHLDLTPADPDMFVVPDPKTLTLLPWKPGVAWVTGDLLMNSKPIPHGPRHVLEKVIDKAKKQGYVMKTGVEAEFFVLSTDGGSVADERDQQAKPCYDQMALMRRYEFIKELCDAMESLGWGPYQNDHEDATGQFEVNWTYSDALQTADRHVFFRYMAKSLAEKYGLRVTFMPKPFSHLTGNGCHTHCSLWNKEGTQNVFLDKKGEEGLSSTAYHFMGGVLGHAEALAALTNPTVNSYKRINAATPESGATWSPNGISYGGNNRTHMIRIPDAGRFELRLVDGAANPYLAQAGILAAGLDGMANKIDPGKRLDVNMYDFRTSVKVKSLPTNLHEALLAFKKNKMMSETLGKEFVESYYKLRMQDWNTYMNQVSDWERQTTLDC